MDARGSASDGSGQCLVFPHRSFPFRQKDLTLSWKILPMTLQSPWSAKDFQQATGVEQKAFVVLVLVKTNVM